MEVSFIEVDGVLTRYYRAGTGPAVVLVHGVGMTADVWIRNIDALAESHTVIAPDLLGCGFTAGMTSKGKSPLREMTDHLLALLEHLDVRTCAIVGSSLGGWLAALCYFREPERFRRIAFVCCELVLMGSPEDVRAMATGSLENGRSAFDNPTLEGVSARLGRLVADPASVPEAVALAQLVANGLPWAREAFERRVGGLCDVSEAAELRVAEELRSINVPVLALWGELDIRGDAVLRVEAEKALRCPSVTLEGTGHLAQLERPALFNRLVGEFIRATPAVAEATTAQ